MKTGQDGVKDTKKMRMVWDEPDYGGFRRGQTYDVTVEKPKPGMVEKPGWFRAWNDKGESDLYIQGCFKRPYKDGKPSGMDVKMGDLFRRTQDDLVFEVLEVVPAKKRPRKAQEFTNTWVARSCVMRLLSGTGSPIRVRVEDLADNTWNFEGIGSETGSGPKASEAVADLVPMDTEFVQVSTRTRWKVVEFVQMGTNPVEKGVKDGGRLREDSYVLRRSNRRSCGAIRIVVSELFRKDLFVRVDTKVAAPEAKEPELRIAMGAQVTRLADNKVFEVVEWVPENQDPKTQNLLRMDEGRWPSFSYVLKRTTQDGEVRFVRESESELLKSVNRGYVVKPPVGDGRGPAIPIGSTVELIIDNDREYVVTEFVPAGVVPRTCGLVQGQDRWGLPSYALTAKRYSELLIRVPEHELLKDENRCFVVKPLSTEKPESYFAPGTVLTRLKDGKAFTVVEFVPRKSIPTTIPNVCPGRWELPSYLLRGADGYIRVEQWRLAKDNKEFVVGKFEPEKEASKPKFTYAEPEVPGRFCVGDVFRRQNNGKMYVVTEYVLADKTSSVLCGSAGEAWSCESYVLTAMGTKEEFTRVKDRVVADQRIWVFLPEETKVRAERVCRPDVTAANPEGKAKFQIGDFVWSRPVGYVGFMAEVEEVVCPNGNPSMAFPKTPTCGGWSYVLKDGSGHRWVSESNLYAPSHEEEISELRKCLSKALQEVKDVSRRAERAEHPLITLGQTTQTFTLAEVVRAILEATGTQNKKG